MSEEKRIYVHPQTINEMQEKYGGFDMEGRIKKLLDHYNQSPFREGEKKIWLDEVKEFIILYNRNPEEIKIKEYKEVETSAVRGAVRAFGIEGQTEIFMEEQPFFYDEGNLFWLWDKKEFRWVLSNEINLLNLINSINGIEIINSKNRTEIINCLKQKGRLNTPKPIEKSWVQFKNKIYDIKTGKDFEATSEYFVTNPIPWKVGENEETPTIDKYFEEWVGEKYKDNLYEFLAYNVSTDKFMQRIFAFCGGGSNGKGTFIKLNYKFLGDENCVSSEIKSLSEDKFEPAVIYKKLLCVMGEVSHGDLKNTNQIKKIAGEDKISFQYKGKTPFTATNTATCVCLTNSLPATPDKSLGFYRKWCIVDFPNQFSEIKKDLIESIPEIEFENLAKKCLSILKRLYETRKFSHEGNFEERMQRYEERSNPVMRYLEKYYDEEVGGCISIREFANSCNEHLKKNHLRILSAIQIGKIIREEGFSVSPRKIGDVSSIVILNLTRKNTMKTSQTTETTQISTSSPHGKSSEISASSTSSTSFEDKKKDKRLDFSIKPSIETINALEKAREDTFTDEEIADLGYNSQEIKQIQQLNKSEDKNGTKKIS